MSQKSFKLPGSVLDSKKGTLVSVEKGERAPKVKIPRKHRLPKVKTPHYGSHSSGRLHGFYERHKKGSRIGAAALFLWGGLTVDSLPWSDNLPDLPKVDPVSPLEVLAIFPKAVTYGLEKLDGGDDPDSATLTSLPLPPTSSEATTTTANSSNVGNAPVPTLGPVSSEASDNTLEPIIVSVSPTTAVVSAPPAEATTTQPTIDVLTSYQLAGIPCQGSVEIQFLPSDKYPFIAMTRAAGERGTPVPFDKIDDTNGIARQFWDQWKAQALAGVEPQQGDSFESPRYCEIPAELVAP